MNFWCREFDHRFGQQAWRYVHIVPRQSIFDLPMSDGRQLQVCCALLFMRPQMAAW